jgi:hypothetical protein
MASSRTPHPSRHLLAKARELGVEFDEFVDAATLRRLIANKRLTAKPTAYQQKLATELGLEYTEDTTSAELDDMIREESQRRSKQTLEACPFLAEGKFIVYNGVVFLVRTLSLTTYKVELSRAVPTSGQRQIHTLYAYELANTCEADSAKLRDALWKLQGHKPGHNRS